MGGEYMRAVRTKLTKSFDAKEPNFCKISSKSSELSIMECLLLRKKKEMSQVNFTNEGISLPYCMTCFNIDDAFKAVWLPIFSSRDEQLRMLQDLWPKLCFNPNNGNLKFDCKHKKCIAFRQAYPSITKLLSSITLETPKIETTNDVTTDSVIISPKIKCVVSQFTTSIRHIPILDCLFIKKVEASPINGKFICEIAANKLQITRNMQTIPCAFTTTNLDEDHWEKTSDVRGMFQENFQQRQMLFWGPYPQIIDGTFGYIECDEFITDEGNQNNERIKNVQIVFKQWKNSTFPMRNDNENQFLLLANLFLGATSIDRPWYHQDLTAKQVRELWECSDKLHSLLTGEKNLCFYKSFIEKEDWTNWLKTSESQISSNASIEIQRTLSQLQALKQIMHNDRGFHLVCNATRENIQHFINQFQIMYFGQDMLKYVIHMDDSYTFTTDNYMKDHCPLAFHKLPRNATVESQQIIPEADESLTYMLIKPYGLRRNALGCIHKELDNIGAEIIWYHTSPKTEAEAIAGLYPNCKGRPYGYEWINYLTSGPVIHMIVKGKSSDVRIAALNARIDSKYIWTRNVIHSSSSINEASDNIKLIKTIFQKTEKRKDQNEQDEHDDSKRHCSTQETD